MPGPKVPARLRWAEVSAQLSDPQSILLDTRSTQEYLGEETHKNAARPGRIPGAIHLQWDSLLRSQNDPHLQGPAALREIFTKAGVSDRSHVVTSCQSGTRSAVAYFALRQIGMPDSQITNYNGSWAEYSRLDRPIEIGPPINTFLFSPGGR